MRRFTLIILFVFQTIFAQAQAQSPFDIWAETSGISRYIFDQNDAVMPPVDTLDALTKAYFKRLDSLGITYNDRVKSYIDYYWFKAIRDSSIVDSIACAWLIVPDSSLTIADTTRLKQNLMSNQYTLVTYNALTWQLGLGVNSNGTSSYFDTQFNPTTDSTKCKLMSTGLGVYIRTNVAGGMDMGYNSSGSDRTLICVRYTGDAFYTGINSTFASGTVTNSIGFWYGSRTGANALVYYKNGGAITSPNTAVGTKPNMTFFICAIRANTGLPAYYTQKQYSLAVITAGLSVIGQRKLNNIIERLMDYLKIGIQP